MSEFGQVAYSLFALQQPVTLEEMSDQAAQRRLLLASALTPEWFAAAASTGSSLLDMAPELQVLPADLDEADAVDVDGMDLVWLYAPELSPTEESKAHARADHLPPAAEPEEAEPAQPSAARQIGLLKELSDFDG